MITTVDANMASLSYNAKASKAQRADICKPTENALEPTVFHEPWWLEIASEGRYEATEVTNSGQVIGRMPFVKQTKFGVRSLDMPMLTHFLGPAVMEGDGSLNNRSLKRLNITKELIQKLPAASLIRMKMHHGVSDTIAFQEHQFRTSVQFTHEIDPQPVEELWSNLRNKTRNVIRRAMEQVWLQEVKDPAEFMAFYLHNLHARQTRSYLNARVCTQLIEASITRQRGRIIGAYDDSRNLLAANFYVWDAKFYYYLLTTRSATSPNGTVNLLVWEGIKEAAQNHLVFDSDGLNSNGGVLFFAGLGGIVKPRYIVSRSNMQGHLLEAFRDAVWGKNFFVRG